LVSMTNGPVYPQSGHRYIAPVYPPIQRMIFSEWHFGQNRFVILSMLISRLSDEKKEIHNVEPRRLIIAAPSKKLTAGLYLYWMS